MSRRGSARLAWTLWTLSVLLMAAARLLEHLNRGWPVQPASGLEWFADAATLLSWSFITAVGALVAARQPSNPIGWLFCAASCLLGLGGAGSFSEQYAIYGLVTNAGALPAALAIAWLGSVARAVGFIPLVTFLPLLFPTGRLPSPRWRPIAYFGLAMLVFGGLINGFTPGALVDSDPPIGNPLGITQLAQAFDIAELIVAPVGYALVLTCVISVFVRFRRSRADERQQIKWFAFAAAWIVVVAAVGGVLALIRVPWIDVAAFWLYPLSVFPLPIAVGVAVLKYRLYDIDRLINRTVVYGALTAGLALVYWASVFLLQQALRPITPSGDLAIIGSTLAVAALFQPLRGQIQDVVDRRFYRARYQTQHTIEGFSATLRQEIDLDSLNTELVGVVSRTMQPTHVSLWLRSTAGRNQ